MKKITSFVNRMYLNAKSRLENEDGMATVETVILIVVAVILVGLLVNFLTKEGFTTSTGETTGLIGYLFDMIKQKLTF